MYWKTVNLPDCFGMQGLHRYIRKCAAFSHQIIQVIRDKIQHKIECQNFLGVARPDSIICRARALVQEISAGASCGWAHPFISQGSPPSSPHNTVRTPLSSISADLKYPDSPPLPKVSA